MFQVNDEVTLVTGRIKEYVSVGSRMVVTKVNDTAEVPIFICKEWGSGHGAWPLLKSDLTHFQD